MNFCYEHVFILASIIGIVLSAEEELGKMSFKSPELTDEEQHSSHLPSNLKCDACTAISFQVICVFVSFNFNYYLSLPCYNLFA